MLFSRRLLQVAGLLLLVTACSSAAESSVDVPGSSTSPATTVSTAIESGPVGPVGLIADFELSIDGQRRVYDVYVPASHWSAAVPSPVVVLLHGQRGSRSDIDGGTSRPAPYREWQTIADADNVLLLVPQGATGANGHAGWNDCRNDVVGNPGVDDVGGAMAGRRGEILSADASIQYWVDHRNTVTNPEAHAFADIDSSDNSTVERLLYTGGDNNSQVALFSVAGAGHTEPSITYQYSRVVRRLLGEQNHDIEMATQVWTFFTS